MASFRIAVSGFALLALAGCNATLDPVSPKEPLPGYLTVSSGMPVPYLFQGSAIQWNQHYAVSAAHIPMLPDVVHRCSTGCDLVFIRREAEGPVPNWRPTVVGETLEVVGLSPSLVTVRGIGVSKAAKVRLDRAGDTTAYAVNDAPIVKGMSGGPVYGADDAVVGMTIGIFQPQHPRMGARQNDRKLSVYVPYEIIQKEWRFFMEGRNRNES